MGTLIITLLNWNTWWLLIQLILMWRKCFLQSHIRHSLRPTPFSLPTSGLRPNLTHFMLTEPQPSDPQRRFEALQGTERGPPAALRWQDCSFSFSLLSNGRMKHQTDRVSYEIPDSNCFLFPHFMLVLCICIRWASTDLRATFWRLQGGHLDARVRVVRRCVAPGVWAGLSHLT